MSKVWLTLTPLLSLLVGQVTKQDGKLAGKVADVRPPAAAPSCTICHPGALKSLRRSVHASLLRPGHGDASCLQCHATAVDHQRHVGDRKHPAGLGRSACVRCHDGQRFDLTATLAWSHPGKRQAARLQRRADAEPVASPITPTSIDSTSHYRIDGTLRAGWRFVNIDGNQRVFAHDYGLDSGPRLADLDLALRGNGHLLGELWVHGLEDRDWSARGVTGSDLSDWFGADVSFRRSMFVYDAQGDFHTLSTTRRWGDGEVHLDPWKKARITARIEHRSLDGRTVQSRIGNANQSPLLPATGVPADRSFNSTTGLLGIEQTLEAGLLSLELGWEEARTHDQLTYSRPSPGNAAFTESETSTGKATQRGPEAMLSLLLGEDGGTSAKLVLAGRHRELGFNDDALLTAFDTSAFTTKTVGRGDGWLRQLSMTASIGQALWEGGRAEVEAVVTDVESDVHFTKLLTTVRTSPVLVVHSRQDLDLVSSIKDREFRLGLSQDFDGVLDASLGWTWVEQRLAFPDLEAGDSDYVSGTVETHGPDASLEWRPDDDWTARASFRFATTGNTTPTETQPELGHLLRVKLRRRIAGGDGYAELFGHWRRAENDVSSTENNFQSYGASLHLPPWDGARLEVRGAFTQIDARTLTNFYFAPSATPVPTVVLFEGDTVALDLQLDTPIMGSLRSLTSFGLQTTSGTLDSTLLRFDEELLYRQSERLAVGLRGSFLRFTEPRQGAVDDYDAVLAFLFAELRL